MLVQVKNHPRDFVRAGDIKRIRQDGRDVEVVVAIAGGTKVIHSCFDHLSAATRFTNGILSKIDPNYVYDRRSTSKARQVESP